MDAVSLKCQKLDKIKRILISEEEIRAKTKEIGALISREYQGKPLLLVSILKGSFIFLADLCREISIPCEVGFMCAESYYNGTASSGSVNIVLDLKQDISEYNVIIVEDIVDSGRTLSEVVKMLAGRNPISLKVYTLMDKPERREVDFKPDYALFTVPDLFVVGYGLDCGEYYRNLPYVAEYDCS
ncbi:MAG: hypoxanthine phosphoribosyltransferase [Oscillospiraceae bacterium]|nr:hypoxanthine phosphoribosyltransferase [Oscillospiraceae bacterium]